MHGVEVLAVPTRYTAINKPGERSPIKRTPEELSGVAGAGNFRPRSGRPNPSHKTIKKYNHKDTRRSSSGISSRRVLSPADTEEEENKKRKLKKRKERKGEGREKWKKERKLPD